MDASARAARAPSGDLKVADIVAALNAAAERTSMPRVVQWEAHPDVVAEAAEMGVSVDTLVQMAVVRLDARA